MQVTRPASSMVEQRRSFLRLVQATRALHSSCARDICAMLLRGKTFTHPLPGSHLPGLFVVTEP